jgi:hypothetical protein
MESLSDVVDKKFSKSLLHFLKLVDPDRKFGFDTHLVEAWNALTLTEQRRMYLYLLYKKWRGEPFYGTPYEIVKNCHPYPTNWNGRHLINRLMKDGTRLVSAWYNGECGIYTVDEAKLWQMTNVKPRNF